MTIRKLFPLLLVAVATHVAAFATLPNPASAQLGCGWCYHWTVDTDYHIFFSGADGCGWPGATTPFEYCSRCSSKKGCHDYWDPGPCHIICGPAGGMVAIDVIHEALEAQDLGAFVTAVDGAPATLAVEYAPNAGRIDFRLACNPDAVVKTLSVPTGTFRQALEVAFAQAVRAEKAFPVQGSP